MTMLPKVKRDYLLSVGIEESVVKAMEIGLGAKAMKVLAGDYREKGGEPWRPVDHVLAKPSIASGIKALVLKGISGTPTTWEGWDEQGSLMEAMGLVNAANDMVKTAIETAVDGVPALDLVRVIIAGLDKRLAALA